MFRTALSFALQNGTTKMLNSPAALSRVILPSTTIIIKFDNCLRHKTTAQKPDSSVYQQRRQFTSWKLSNEEWAKKLTPEEYYCTREAGTEAPFSGKYYGHKEEGVYTCICCGSELFSSKTKYDSGSGWPSFYAEMEHKTPDGVMQSAVIRRKDVSHGMVRVEVICRTCDAHLGHVFDDGPKPTGERHCINSVCLKFKPKKMAK